MAVKKRLTLLSVYGPLSLLQMEWYGLHRPVSRFVHSCRAVGKQGCLQAGLLASRAVSTPDLVGHPANPD